MARETELFVDHETIRLTREGVWLSNGREITHQEQLRAFARNLGKDEQGYFIRIGRDFKRIEVEDTALFVFSIDGSPSDGYELALTDGSRERLAPSSLAYRPGRLTCRVRRFGGLEEARLLRRAHDELLRELQQDERGYFLVIEGARVELAPANHAPPSETPPA